MYPGDPSSPGAVLTRVRPRRISVLRVSPVRSGVLPAEREQCENAVAISHEPWGPAVPSVYYEIRIAGVLPAEALLDFDRLSASVHQVETVVHGPLQDQAALHGLLARLETFGVQVLEVRRLQDET